MACVLAYSHPPLAVPLDFLNVFRVECGHFQQRWVAKSLFHPTWKRTRGASRVPALIVERSFRIWFATRRLVQFSLHTAASTPSTCLPTLTGPRSKEIRRLSSG